MNQSSSERQPKHKEVDLTIIGGGIYGAWAAYHASRAGIKTLLVEKNDFASATSMASSKLIHGGLRYLENFEFNLVKKSLHERHVLMNMIPNIITPLEFFVPIYKKSRVGPFKLRLGLWVYDWLAKKKKLNKHRKHALNSINDFASKLNQKDLSALLSYSDCQTDDARLVIQIIQKACKSGAEAFNYMEALSYRQEDQHYKLDLLDHENRQQSTIQSKKILICAGPWMNQWLSANNPSYQGSIRLTRGVHLVLPKSKDELAWLLQAPQDGRFFFIIPWYDRTIIGTTDTDADSPEDAQSVNSKDIRYLLDAANHYFPDYNYQEKDILSTYSGLRVLERDQNQHPSKNSREWQCPEISPGCFASIGGKYTSAREDALHCIQKVSKSLGCKKIRDIQTPFDFTPDIDFNAWTIGMQVVAQNLNLSVNTCRWLIFRYAIRIKELYDLVKHKKQLGELIHPELPFIYAEIDYCCRFEKVLHLEDLLRRRIPLMILARYDAEILNRCASICAKHLSWKPSQIEQEIQSSTSQWMKASLLS